MNNQKKYNDLAVLGLSSTVPKTQVKVYHDVHFVVQNFCVWNQDTPKRTFRIIHVEVRSKTYPQTQLFRKALIIGCPVHFVNDITWTTIFAVKSGSPDLDRKKCL